MPLPGNLDLFFFDRQDRSSFFRKTRIDRSGYKIYSFWVQPLNETLFHTEELHFAALRASDGFVCQSRHHLETCDQLACAVWRPARSCRSSRASVAPVPAKQSMAICFYRPGKRLLRGLCRSEPAIFGCKSKVTGQSNSGDSFLCRPGSASEPGFMTDSHLPRMAICLYLCHRELLLRGDLSFISVIASFFCVAICLLMLYSHMFC